MSWRHDDRGDNQTMADAMVVPPWHKDKRTVSGQASNQTGAAAVTMHDGCDLLTDGVVWTGSQDGGNDRMESADGRSDLRDSTQNWKVHTLNSASRPLSKVCHLHYFRLCTCVHQIPIKAVPPCQLAPEPNVKTNAPALSQGAAQHVPTAQRCQAVPMSVGHHQGNPTCNNEWMEDSKGEASRLPKVSTTLISTIYLHLSATHEGNTTNNFNMQGT